jgi:hypothetical protein
MNVGIFRLLAVFASIAIGCLCSTNVKANENLKLPKSETVINADINGNGKLDRVVASYFTRPVLVLEDSRPNSCKTVPGKFVRYTMYADGQKNGRVILEENYGSTRADYWTHRLELGKDLDGDGRKDLVFYMGDDTSDETTYLLQKPTGFKAIYAGAMGLPSYSLDSHRSLVSTINKNVLATWDRSAEVWRSNKYGWVTGNCVAIRAQPNLNSKIVRLEFERNLVTVSPSQSVGDWIALDDDGKGGWINKKYLSFSSPVRWFK